MKCFQKLEPRTCTIEELRASLNLHPPGAEVIPVVAKDGSIGFVITDEGSEVSESILKAIQDQVLITDDLAGFPTVEFVKAKGEVWLYVNTSPMIQGIRTLYPEEIIALRDLFTAAAAGDWSRVPIRVYPWNKEA